LLYKVIIVDDEENGRTVLKLLIEDYFSELQITAICKNIKEAENAIKLQKPDIVLLDVQMPGGNGFDLIARFKEIDFALVFITAHEQYALKALRLSAVDYLLKPVNKTDLQQAIQKSIKFLSLSNLYKENIEAIIANTSQQADKKRLVINKHKGEYVFIKDILCVKAESNYSTICTLTKNYVKEVEDLILEEQQPFLRISRTFLANLNYAVKVTNAREQPQLLLKNNDSLEISKRRWSVLKHIFTDNKIAIDKL
jgi:two-component system, LytTR family, response regulator